MLNFNCQHIDYIHEVNSSHFEVLHNHYCIFQNEKLCIICKYECRTWHNGGYAIDKIDIIIVNKRGPNTDCWGTPLVTGMELDFCPFSTTCCVLFLRKPVIHYKFCHVLQRRIVSKSSAGGGQSQRLSENPNKLHQHAESLLSECWVK